MEDVYNPDKLMYNYMKEGHGRTRADAIRYAIRQADLNNDVEHMVSFRIELCEESEWYGDGRDIVTVFPELLAVADKYAGQFPGIMENVLWTYEDLADICTEFYQIPFDDCRNFLDDFKKRWILSGHSPREPYRMMAEFYMQAGYLEEAGQAVSILRSSHMEHYDCAGCAANTELSYYLANNEKEKAEQIAVKIDNCIFTCGGNMSDSNSIYRMNKRYLRYYIMNGDYEKAAVKARLLEHARSSAIDYKLWASFMCAYVYNNTGRGLRIYKKHWRDIENEKRPEYMYYSFKDAACFFMGLKKTKNEDNVKLQLDNKFPLYSQDNIYSIDSLSQYYYKKAEEVAKKFDQRNGTDKYMKELKMSAENILSYNPEKERQEV